MPGIGYHISHEQFPPGELLQLAVKAEKAGFGFCLSSDHFHPWSEAQGHSGNAWTWLGAAMARTSIPFGVVNCPSFRYHPAIIAQAAATLDEMFPGRFWIAAGSGQALNEAIIGEQWPAKNERNSKLREAVEIMQALWNGETVTRKGLIAIEDAKLYTRPRTTIRTIAAAISPETAGWAAGWADGLITVSQPMDQLRKVIDSWNSIGGEGKPMILKIQVSYAKDREKALQGAFDQWRTNVFGSRLQAEVRLPSQFEEAAAHVKPSDMQDHVLITDDPEQIVDRLQEYARLGFGELVLHNVNLDQDAFIDMCEKHVLPGFQTP